MKTQEGVIVLEDSKSFSPAADGVYYNDLSGMRVFVPYSLLVRLYEGARFGMRRKGINWEDFCDELFKV